MIHPLNQQNVQGNATHYCSYVSHAACACSAVHAGTLTRRIEAAGTCTRNNTPHSAKSAVSQPKYTPLNTVTQSHKAALPAQYLHLHTEHTPDPHTRQHAQGILSYYTRNTIVDQYTHTFQQQLPLIQLCAALKAAQILKNTLYMSNSARCCT